MNLDRALQLATAALAVIGAVFLGLAHESIVLPAALAAAAVASVTLGNVIGWLRLNWMIANLLALAAVSWSLRNFLYVGSEGQLLAIADMLVYLQIVLLFQEKTGRVHWQLIVLSLLQVVVAAALNLGPPFGVLLAAYMAVALSALLLLCRYREWRKLAARDSTSAEPAAPAWQVLLATPSVGPSGGAALGQAGVRTAAVGRQVVLLAVATGVFAGVFFYATPRREEGAWSGSYPATHSLTGVMPEVRLKESGPVHQSNQLVMRVSLSDGTSRRPYDVLGEPYFNGLALTDYIQDPDGSRWIAPPNPRLAHAIRASARPTAGVTSAQLVRQDIMLEGTSRQLFAVLPVHYLPPGIWFSDFQSRLGRSPPSDDQTLRREYRYSLVTSGLRGGRQLHALPHANPLVTPADELIMQNEQAINLKFDEQRFPALTSLAKKIVREEGVEQAGPLAKALALERHFVAPDRYHYSLNLDFPRDRRLDPVEDFVANHHTGHCEYFASALVLMLRSQGIPARLIMGFKGGDFNSIGNYYQVRQKHAHTWVEALLPAGDAPEWEIAGSPSGGGAWYRLDPTPSASIAGSTASGDNPLDRAVQAFDYFELLWRDYVLSLNADKQRDVFYEPVSARALGALPAWTEFRGLRRMMRRLAAQVGWAPRFSPPASTTLSRVLDWRSGLAFVTAGSLCIAGIQLAIWLVRGLGRRRAAAAARTATRRPPRFYRRLESLLARLQLQRAAGQTARELAELAAHRLTRESLPGVVARLPAKIVAAYYRVRFGGASLDRNEEAAIEHALAQLTPAVNQARA